MKFSNEKYSGLFATLCKTEMIEVNQLVSSSNEEGSFSVKRLLADNNRPISHSRYVNDIAWSNKGNKLASVCKDSNLKVWSVTEDSIKLVNRFNTVSQASFVRWDTKAKEFWFFIIIFDLGKQPTSNNNRSPAEILGLATASASLRVVQLGRSAHQQSCKVD